jgi:hypothetical protein
MQAQRWLLRLMKKLSRHVPRPAYRSNDRVDLHCRGRRVSGADSGPTSHGSSSSNQSHKAPITRSEVPAGKHNERTALTHSVQQLTARSYLGSVAGHKPQACSPGTPQFMFALDVPSIQAQPRFTSVAVIDCDAPTQKLAADTVRENANKPLFTDAPAIVRRCEFVGQAVMAVRQSKVVVPVTFKHDAWPSEPSLSL